MPLPPASRGASLPLSFSATPAWESFAALAFPSLRSESASRKPTAKRGHGLIAVADGARTVLAATSSAMDHLDDKALLCVALRAAGVAADAPPTTAIAWDADAGDVSLPASDGDGGGDDELYVLKPAGGYGGFDVRFTRDAAVVARVVAEQAALTAELPFHCDRDYIPGFVLQSHVRSLPVRGGRKFHLRGYVVATHRGWFVHERAEARIAPLPMAAADADDDAAAFRAAHVTNGAGGTSTERCLASDPKLAEDVGADVEARLRSFLRRVFGALKATAPAATPDEGAFAVGAADVMVDERRRFRLLELNVNPSAPPFDACARDFADHLADFLNETAALVARGAHPAFAPVLDPRRAE